MSNNRNLKDPDLINLTVRRIVEDMIRADLLMRKTSLLQEGTRDLWPCVQLTSRMSGKISFTVDGIEQHGFLLGLFRKEREETLADIRFEFNIRPSLAGSQSAVLDPLLYYLPPPILKNPAQAGSKLGIALQSGRTLEALPQRNGGFNFVLIDSGRESRQEVISVELIADFIETTAAWLKSGKKGERLRFKIPGPDWRLGKLIGAVINEFGRLIDMLDGEPDNIELNNLNLWLKNIHPHIGADFKIDRLLSRLLVQLDEKGDLILKRNQRRPSEENAKWQQFDVLVSLEPRMKNYEIVLSMFPPDFLVQGDTHKAFTDVLKEDGNIKRLWESQEKNPGFSDAEIRDFLTSAEYYFIRINGDDKDIVFMKGEHGNTLLQFFYIMDFKVKPYPDQKEIRVTGMELIAWKKDDSQWRQEKAIPDPVKEYVNKFISVLMLWQQGVAAS